MIGDVAQPKRDAISSEDMSHGDAERRPGKLDECEHGVYITEAERKFNSRQNLKMAGPSEQSSRGAEEMMALDPFCSCRIEEGEPPDHPSCSRNAHDKNVLVRRAQ